MGAIELWDAAPGCSPARKPICKASQYAAIQLGQLQCGISRHLTDCLFQGGCESLRSLKSPVFMYRLRVSLRRFSVEGRLIAPPFILCELLQPPNQTSKLISVSNHSDERAGRRSQQEDSDAEEWVHSSSVTQAHPRYALLVVLLRKWNRTNAKVTAFCRPGATGEGRAQCRANGAGCNAVCRSSAPTKKSDSGNLGPGR